MIFQRFFVFILSTLNIQNGHRCRLNTRVHFNQPLPVIIKNGQLLEPTDRWGNVDLEAGDVLTLSCISEPIRHPNAIRELATATVTCEDGDIFKNEEWLTGMARFPHFTCMNPPNYSSLRTNRTCYNNNTIIEVGYTIEGVHYPVYESCFNENTLNAIYSKYTQKSYNANFQTRVDRPYFIDDGHYGVTPLEHIYSAVGLRNAVFRLVGNKMDDYISSSEFLSRGHLAAKTDFALAFGQRATFHYVNCAAQWYGFNSGNWNTLEVDLRNRVNAAGYDTVIYTGTYGITGIPDKYGASVNMHLSTDINNNPIIPVPLYYYKVVYDPNLRRGTVFVGINNPYYTADKAKSLFFCPDVCRHNRDFSWLSWHPDDPREGYCFCCTVPDFRDTVDHLPYLEVTGLLT